MRRWWIAAALMLAGCAGESRAPSPSVAPPAEASPLPRPSIAQPAAAPVASWHPARVHADAPATPERATVVLAGDTLAAIAERADASVGALAAANHLAPPYSLAPGQRLIVPAGHWHTVRAGETGIAIARAYGAAWPRVLRANGLTPPYALEIGDRLLIPARVVAAKPTAAPSTSPTKPVPATVEARAHAFNLDIDALLGKAPETRRRATLASATQAATAGAPLSRDAGEVAAKRTEGVPLPGTPSVIQAPSSPARGREMPALPTAIHLEWPLTGRVLSAFGPKPGGRFNDGVNIAAVAGTPVRAAADGTVAYAGNGVAAFGGLILLRHSGGWLTAYAHCEALLVAKGDTVRAGQLIAKAGATGEVDEPQLHFEVRRGRTPVDPLRLLPGR